MLLPKVEELGSIMMVVDHFSKHGTFIVMSIDCRVEEAAHLLMKHEVKYLGIFESIISDRNPQFMGYFWTEVFKILGLELLFPTSFHLQTNRHTKWVDSLLEYLLHFVSAKQHNWAHHLTWLSFATTCKGASRLKLMRVDFLLPHKYWQQGIWVGAAQLASLS